MTSPSRFKQSGFSLLTVLFMILLLSLATVAIYSSIPPSRTLAATKLTNERMTKLEAAIVRFAADNAGVKPSSLDDLVTTTGTACAADTNQASGTYGKLQGWCGPYIDRPLGTSTNDFKSDGWGTLFLLGPATLKSCGPNLSCGDADDIIDSI